MRAGCACLQAHYSSVILHRQHRPRVSQSRPLPCLRTGRRMPWYSPTSDTSLAFQLATEGKWYFGGPFVKTYGTTYFFANNISRTYSPVAEFQGPLFLWYTSGSTLRSRSFTDQFSVEFIDVPSSTYAAWAIIPAPLSAVATPLTASVTAGGDPTTLDASGSVCGDAPCTYRCGAPRGIQDLRCCLLICKFSIVGTMVRPVC